MNFDNECDKILKTLNEDYTVTLREILYSRYGKELADKMISDINAAGEDEYLKQKFKLPSYSQQNLDRVIPVKLKQLAQGVGGATRTTTTVQNTPMGQKRYVDREVHLNTNEPYNISGIAELEGGKASYQQDSGAPYDVLGHELTHTAQNFDDGTLKKSKLTGSDLQYEIAPVAGELKRWYFGRTGIALGRFMTDDEFNAFMNYCKKYNAFDKLPYGSEIDFEKWLRSSEGRAAFKLLVKTTPMNSNEMVA